MTPKRKRVRKSKWRTAAEANRRKDLDFEKPATPRSSGNAAILLSGLAGLILLGFLAVFLVLSNSHPSDQAEHRQLGPPAPPEMIWEGAVPRAVLDKFQNATSFEERLSCLMFPDIVEERARAFFSDGPGKDEKIQSFSSPQLRTPEGADETAAYRLKCLMKNAPSRFVLLSIDPEGPKIDFDFYARYCATSWDDLLSGKVSEASEMRIVIKKDHYYFGEFSDERRWFSIKGISPDLEQSINLYLDRSHPRFKEVSSILEEQMIRANVALTTRANSWAQRAFEIPEVNSLDWVSLRQPTVEATPSN